MLRHRGLVVALVLVGAAVLATRWWVRGESPLEVRVFEDVTTRSGLDTYTGTTHGAAWGDFDGDGRPDLYLTNHLNGARLYRNLGGGRFADVTDQWFSKEDLGGDKHGAAWADFDNDGRLDLVQLTGAERGVGSEAKRLFANRGTHFENVAEAAGVANLLGRTRMPLWVDLNRDGRLDLFQGAEPRFDDKKPPVLFLQDNGRFEPSNLIPFASANAPFCILSELTANGGPDLVCRVPQRGKTAQIFNLGQPPPKELDLLPVTAFEDLAAGDFNNDGFIDLYLARKNPAPPVAFGRPGPNELIADTWIDERNVDEPLGFRFSSAGRVEVRVASFPSDAITPKRIHIGTNGDRPGSLEFTLSPQPTGRPSFTPGVEPGIYVGGERSYWEVLVSAEKGALEGVGPRYQQVALRIRSSAPITNVEPIGTKPAGEEAPARLFMNHGGKLVEESEKRGVNARVVPGVNVVAADFNNDMYLDLFVVASGDIGKHQNLLLLNRGDGRFDVVAGAGGAAGVTSGVGDSVTTVDFDGDGFIDLLVATGGSMGRSLGLPSEAGAYRLYRNVANNGNHWLELDLEGTRSNRDAIGARVDLTAGGVTQVRVQDGGVHHRGQNHSRIHFGLGRNAKADRIRIRWPNGSVQELTDVTADRVMRVREP